VIVHLNGQLLPADQARISPLDRGFIFGDGIYEGLRSIPDQRGGRDTRIIGWRQHVDRMNNGLREAAIDFDAAALEQPTHDLLKANSLTDAFIYWQVTSGTPRPTDPPRSRVKPRGLPPTVFGYCTPQPPLESITTPPTKKVITCRDIRWEMGHIKSISLFGNVWATRKADQAGAEEVIFIRGGDENGRGGLVTEGLATNLVFSFTRNGKTEIATPSLESAPMLHGVTRMILTKILPEIVERPIHAEEVAQAGEIMLIGTTTLVTSIVSINGRAVRDGKPGPVAQRLLGLLLDAIRNRQDDFGH
jgi:D-alanine transaminase